MSDCDRHRLTLLMGDARPFERHVAGCADCGRDLPSLRGLGHALRAAPDPGPAPALLWAAIEQRTAPILDHHAETSPRLPSLAAVVAAALLPLPILVPLNLLSLWGLHELLSTLLPSAVSLALVAGQATFLTLLLGLTYASVPLFANRQRRALLEEST
jgi:hypothetical protein